MNKYKIVAMDGNTMGEDVNWEEIQKLGDFTMFADTKQSEAAERIKDADIVITNKLLIGEEEIKAAKDLKLIAVAATGYNQVNVEAAHRRNIIVCNVMDYSSNAVAEHVFAFILDLARGLTEHANSVASGEWAKASGFSYWKGSVMELYGKTLGVIGYGNIGSKVARLGNAFGMNVLAYNPIPRDQPDFSPFAFASEAEVFAKSDFVSLNCPLTSENKGMINLSLLKTMKKNAFLVNCARGGLVNEADLRRALDEGIIAGAGLDVVEKEPMPLTSPLMGAPNCLITPHMAWAARETRQRLLLGVANNIRSFMEGSPTNVV